jgi:uncharacterized protein (TIGR02646 family)
LRYIDTKSFTLPDGWSEIAESALRKAKLATDPRKRASLISNHSSIWARLKDRLANLSNDKCWYCETERERSDDAVDHFRPKNQVAESSKHEGYWWLAFDWTNYRFSCTYCNSRRKDKVYKRTSGKQDHFPLWDEDGRAYEPDDDLNTEEPCLLDPTVAMDPGLLWFNDEGRAVPRYPDHKRSNLRAEKSIELYNLNYFDTEVKRMRLYRKIKSLVVKGNLCFEQVIFADTPKERALAEKMLTQIMEELMEAISADAQFSAAARTYLIGFRDDDHDWIDNVLRAS